MIAQIDTSLVNVKLKLYEAQVMLLHTNEAPVMHFFPAENNCEELKLHMVCASKNFIAYYLLTAAFFPGLSLLSTLIFYIFVRF